MFEGMGDALGGEGGGGERGGGEELDVDFNLSFFHHLKKGLT